MGPVLRGEGDRDVHPRAGRRVIVHVHQQILEPHGPSLAALVSRPDAIWHRPARVQPECHRGWALDMGGGRLGGVPPLPRVGRVLRTGAARRRDRGERAGHSMRGNVRVDAGDRGGSAVARPLWHQVVRAAQPGGWPSRGERMELGSRRSDRWAIILAGGEGVRLRPLTRRIAGDERPKQFCPLLDGETLLDRTRARVARTVRPDRTCLVLTRSHERFFAPLLAKGPPGPLVVQPCGRGTAPAILYGLLRVADEGPSDAVALFPSDHYFSDDARFMAHVEAAFATVEAHPDLVVLLGMEADGPEVQYGWIETGDPLLDGSADTVYRVRRFWEKPVAAIAETLFERGCLWNSFVLVARVPALLALIRRGHPRSLRRVHVGMAPALDPRRDRGHAIALREAPRDELLGRRPGDEARQSRGAAGSRSHVERLGGTGSSAPDAGTAGRPSGVGRGGGSSSRDRITEWVVTFQARRHGQRS